ncbi:hypothetical protein WZ342_2578 [Enterococcus faecalis]|nr:hypothetical protein WZ342_2578 [Enterococcus faecalis]
MLSGNGSTDSLGVSISCSLGSCLSKSPSASPSANRFLTLVEFFSVIRSLLKI